MLALEDAGVLTWVNRLVRIRDAERDPFGHIASGEPPQTYSRG